MEHGRPRQSFATSDSRVSSPSAAKTGAFASRWAAILLRFLGDMALDVLHLLCPTAVIHAKRFEAAVAGDFVEAGFCDHKQRAGRGLLQPEFDERGRLLRIVFVGIHGIGMPGEGKE